MRQPSGPSPSLTLVRALASYGGVWVREGVGGKVGGGGVSSMNQSWCAMRNSSTSWLSWCSVGESSWSGCDISPGRKITARSTVGWSFVKKSRGNVVEEGELTLCGHQVFVGFAGKDGEEVEDVEKEILVGVGHRVDEPLVCRDGRFLIVRLFGCANR